MDGPTIVAVVLGALNTFQVLALAWLARTTNTMRHDVNGHLAAAEARRATDDEMALRAEVDQP